MEETFRHQFIKAIEDCRTALDDVKKKKEISNDDDNYQPISNEEKVKEYLEEIKDIPEEKIAYVDETGIDKCLYREYGYAPCGQKVYNKISGKRLQRTNIIAAKLGNEITAPMQYNSKMDLALFEMWFEK